MEKHLNPEEYFDHRKLCENCPFRKSSPKGWLGKKRATEIATSVQDDQHFHCHKTLDYNYDQTTESEDHTRDAKVCTGSFVLDHKLGNANFQYRLASMFKLTTIYPDRYYKLVFSTFEEFINHHTD